jgi:hypothetical protein
MRSPASGFNTSPRAPASSACLAVIAKWDLPWFVEEGLSIVNKRNL